MISKITKNVALIFLIQILVVLNVHAKFVLYEPKTRPITPAPLFVMIHGFSSSAQDIATITRFSKQADKEGFYVLYPESDEINEWMKGWAYYLPEEQAPGKGEANLIIEEIKKIIQHNPIDSQKIFLAGMSAGASLSSILVSCYPDMFQGVVFHSGTSYGLSSTWKEALIDLKAGPSYIRTANTACNPKDYKGKVMVFHGTNDELVNPKHFERYISDFLGGVQTESISMHEDSTHFAYEEKRFMRNGVSLGKAYLVDGMIHTWSGGTNDGKDKDNAPTKIGPDATALILNFFLHED